LVYFDKTGFFQYFKNLYYGESNERTRRLFLEGLETAVEMAAAKAVLLAFETMETELLNTVAKAMTCTEN
jgi:L-ribulose-5-phosphate 3-epimerase